MKHHLLFRLCSLCGLVVGIFHLGTTIIYVLSVEEIVFPVDSKFSLTSREIMLKWHATAVRKLSIPIQ